MSIDIQLYRVTVGLFCSVQHKMKGTKRFDSFELVSWMAMILLLGGDIHTNPGPSPERPTSSSDSSFTMINDFSKTLSFVHYNVQSFLRKKDIIEGELDLFDIISLTETWLAATTDSDALLFQNYSPPFRKDRGTDNHGGILVYVNNQIPAIRRPDLEVHGIESIWIELQFKTKKLLYGTFYRPPNSAPYVLTQIENSIGLAFDTNISDIVVAGDFNLDMLKPLTSAKVLNITSQYNMSETIQEPTHFTETSNSLIDLFLVSSSCKVALTGVGEPFLDQNTRYHCPIFCCIDLTKPHLRTYKRMIWQFNRGDYNGLRRETACFPWETLQHDNIDTYASNITDTINKITKEHIPNKIVTIRQSSPPWFHNEIRKQIRKRKRAYDKAKKSNNPHHWQTYNQIRNKTTTLLRNAKHNLTVKLADKLKTEGLTPTDFWKTLKQFRLKTTKNTGIQILNDMGHM
ncbi:uncharacterized protein LOC128556710 [Mercenaria mercenaria]|uniref:uncharacterized protein LOC128556710 n=1 Tax=Mercenaria mercenaria TaxID=6596 RepID=UPI00234EC2F8|nr:uncharacterized protein LOC128556710 [Mercenaria mercenaria]